MLNQAPASGHTRVADLPFASEMPVPLATPLIVSAPGLAKICAFAAPALVIHNNCPPIAGGSCTLSAAVAQTAIRVQAVRIGVASAWVPPACAVMEAADHPLPLARMEISCRP